MPCKYTTDPIDTQDAIDQLRWLCLKMCTSCSTLLGIVLTSYNERMDYLLHLLRFRGMDTSHI